MILLIGANGSMGKRYQAILRYLGKDFRAVDKETRGSLLSSAAIRCSSAIIATPTQTHEEVISTLIPSRIPILCEKPVTKNLKALDEILSTVKKNKTPFQMVAQYKMLVQPDRIGRTRYNYFRHGNDGLVWDCMQIIALARGEVTLQEESPVWSCMINGQALKIQDMDAAYIAFIQNWLNNPNGDLGWIRTAHEKTKAENDALFSKSIAEDLQ